MISDDATEFRAGRGSIPFAHVPQWVLLAEGPSPAAKALYALYCGLLPKGESATFCDRVTLARMLGCKANSVKTYNNQLTSIGAIDVEVAATMSGRSNVVTVHSMPPEGYEGVMSCWAARSQIQQQRRTDPQATGDAPKNVAPPQKSPKQGGGRTKNVAWVARKTCTNQEPIQELNQEIQDVVENGTAVPRAREGSAAVASDVSPDTVGELSTTTIDPRITDILDQAHLGDLDPRDLASVINAITALVQNRDWTHDQIGDRFAGVEWQTVDRPYPYVMSTLRNMWSTPPPPMPEVDESVKTVNGRDHMTAPRKPVWCGSRSCLPHTRELIDDVGNLTGDYCQCATPATGSTVPGEQPSSGSSASKPRCDRCYAQTRQVVDDRNRWTLCECHPDYKTPGISNVALPPPVDEPRHQTIH